jgi:hypothetical protein
MTAANYEPTLHFFRAKPQDWISNPPLVSSLQAFETSILLIAMGRYPSALISCASAIESAMKAKRKIPSTKRDIGLAELISDAKKEYPQLKNVEETGVSQFKAKRDQVTHYGYSPSDDEDCGKLLALAGYPFLEKCYEELFGFHLDWMNISPGCTDFHSLSTEEKAKAGLETEFASHFRNSKYIYIENRRKKLASRLYAFKGLSHYIRRLIKRNEHSITENLAMERSWEIGLDYDAQQDVKLELGFAEPKCDIDCPFCEDAETMVIELDQHRLNHGKVVIDRAYCVACGYFINERKLEPLHAEALLTTEIERKKQEICSNYGITAV